MNLHSDDVEQTMELEQVSRYLPEKITRQIERHYYAQVNFQAELDYVAHNEEFLANPLRHVALYSDHGVVHVRDVARNILVVLDTINGVLIPRREPLWLEFMKGYGVMLAYNHDIGMMDFSAFGRAMHPEFATQAVFSPAYDDIVETIWTENWGNIAWRLINLVEEGALVQEPKLVLRELLSLAVAHSKSKVPIEVLNDPIRLRQVMLTATATDLHHLYHDQQVARAREKLTQAQKCEPDPAKLEKLTLALQAALSARAEFLGQNTPLMFEGISLYYTNFESQAFTWLVSRHPALGQMVADVIDTLRALRVADALRQRGTTLKTSGGYQVFIDQNTAKALIALQKGSGELLLLESDDPLSIGEANMASSELTLSGDLRVSFHRGSFLNQETTRRAALSGALVIDDIQRDTIESFYRAEPVTGLKLSQDIQILIEETDDNLSFADLILQELNTINPELGRRSRIVPSLKYVSPSERQRYLLAQDPDWRLEQRQKILARVAQSGHKTQQIDPQKAFTDVRLTELKEGEVLIKVGAPPGFVYVPMGDGLYSTPLGGYQAYKVTPWIPLGNTRVIRGDVQEATITAEKAIKLLMIPKEIYLKYWHDAYNVSEFATALQRLYSEDETRGFELTLAILEQVALIDGTLDEAEVGFIQKFTESYGIKYSAEQIRTKLLTHEPSDFVTLRQSTLDYLALKPPYLQVARLKDLINLLVSIDQNISDRERLILAELNSLLANYLDEDKAATLHKVYIVPQNQEQDEGIRALLPSAPKIKHDWGYAYLCGSFYSKDYADMIRERYRALKFYAIEETENIES